eukprot:CAMPEP_0202719696 /NCGR_PEP_ID=MMETSP1385-20130828/133725_1 /ASSEMBLY_ACC=CAM_ASM_000861 /TAXON_ID=933848 /ORGANISM="Elphidium margaritaceum" /LENGTH=225 /DNA_ID=CAMNT_0049383035 /DNA_START=20 /DNA_END=697 /DNA_ORIENTATION=+
MTDQDEMPPPLEDCADLLRSREQRQRYSPYMLNDDCYETVKQAEKKECNRNVKKKKSSNKNKNKRNGFHAGFLLNSANKKASNKKKKNTCKTERLEVKEAGNALVITEAQQKLKDSNEGRMGEMAQKLHENQNVWNAMMKPEFSEALQEMAENPIEALKKYQEDPSILSTFGEVVQTMYGQSLTSISKDIHAQTQKERNTNLSAAEQHPQLYDKLKKFTDITPKK